MEISLLDCRIFLGLEAEDVAHQPGQRVVAEYSADQRVDILASAGPDDSKPGPWLRKPLRNRVSTPTCCSSACRGLAVSPAWPARSVYRAESRMRSMLSHRLNRSHQFPAHHVWRACPECAGPRVDLVERLLGQARRQLPRFICPLGFLRAPFSGRRCRGTVIDRGAAARA